MPRELLRLILPWPPTVNSAWRCVKSRVLLSRSGRAYREAVVAKVGVFDPIKHPRLGVDLVLMPPDKRRRDVDNYLKALFDALTHARVWDDDSQVRYITVRLLDQPGGTPGSADVSIYTLSEGQPDANHRD